MRFLKIHVSLTLLFICLLIHVLVTPVFSVREYKPVIEDPMLEKWRWVKFPELSSRGIRCMTEDINSAMWFGLDEGLINYDGYHWQDHNAANGFTDAPVRAVLCSQDDKIYAGTDSGLFVHDPSGWKNVFITPAGSGLIYNTIIELDGDNILCATNLGLLWLNNSTITIYMTNYSRDKMQLSDSHVIVVPERLTVGNQFNVSDIYLDVNGDLWIASGYDNGNSGKILIGKVDVDSDGDFEFITVHSENPDHRFYNGSKIIQTKDKKIWIINNQHDQGLLTL